MKPELTPIKTETAEKKVETVTAYTIKRIDGFMYQVTSYEIDLDKKTVVEIRHLFKPDIFEINSAKLDGLLFQNAQFSKKRK